MGVAASSQGRGCWWSPYGNVGDVSVISVDLTPDADHESDAMNWLRKEERLRCDNYHFAGPRRQFALTRAALRSILCDKLGCANQQLTFGLSKYGKPFALVDGMPAAISFNVSHSGRHGLLAFAPEGRVGVDVEELSDRPDIDALSSAVFSPEELAEVASSSGDAKTRLFFRLWTMKEALLKALGTGMYTNPALFEVPPSMRRGCPIGVFQFPNSPEVNWRLDFLGNEHFAAATAHELHPHPANALERGQTA